MRRNDGSMDWLVEYASFWHYDDERKVRVVHADAPEEALKSIAIYRQQNPKAKFEFLKENRSTE